MRRKGTGSITRLEDKPRSKCRKWRLMYSDEKGRHIRRFTGTYSAAEVEMTKFIEEVEVSTKAVLFDDYAAKWLAKRRKDPDVLHSTIRSNETDVRRLLFVFSGKHIHELTHPVIDDGLDRIKNGENATGNVLSGTTMNKTYSVLSMILQSACYDLIIPSNPCGTVKPPKREKPSRRAIPSEELKTVLERLYAMPIDSHTIAVRLAVLAGLRRSEIVALRWGDVKDGCVVVSASIDENTGRLKQPKTSAGFRSVPMLPSLERDIETWREIQESSFRAIGEELIPSTPVCLSYAGNHMRAQNLYRWWISNRWELGTDAGLHELRHTFLTMLANSGANMAVLKSIAGWSDLSVAATYIHEDVSASRHAVARLADSMVQDAAHYSVHDEGAMK